VVLVPRESPLREQVAEALGVEPAELTSEVSESTEAVLVDVGEFESLSQLEALLGKATVGRLPLVAVVGGRRADALELARAPLFQDFVGKAALKKELALRLAQAQARFVAQREALKRQRDLALLLDLTADYAGSLDVEALLHDVTRKLAEELGIARASLVVLDEEQGTGLMIAASDDATLKNLRIDLSRYPEIREVIRTRRPVIVEDATSHPLLDGVKTAVAARGIRAIAALPLAVSGKVLGALLVRASSKRTAFSPREIDFLATVSHATAVALRNARLLQSVQQDSQAEKSARLAAEERARTLQRYEAYFAHVSDGVALIDARAEVLSLNPAGAQMLGLEASQARGRHVVSVFSPTDEALVMDMLVCAQRGEQRKDIDIVVRPGSGRSLTLSVSASPLREEGAAVILSFRDVTAARALANELRHAKEFLERLIDSSVDAIIAADMSGKIILFNRGAEAICGYAKEEALATLDVRQLYPEGVARHVMRRLRDGKGQLGVSRQEIVTRSGERVPVNMTASIVYEGGREAATVGIFTDLRDRMQLEEKLSLAEGKLQESERNAVIVALAGTAAHELNQPLTSVMGYAELLKRKLKDGDFAFKPVDIIYREAERMAEIVRKIGKITRYETKAYIGSSKILDLDKASSHEE
jgi:PAS domain S-box-containing protein